MIVSAIKMIVIWFLRLICQMTRKADQNDLNRQRIMVFKVKWWQAQNYLQQKWTFFYCGDHQSKLILN